MQSERTGVIIRDKDIRFCDFTQDVVLGSKWFRKESWELVVERKQRQSKRQKEHLNLSNLSTIYMVIKITWMRTRLNMAKQKKINHISMDVGKP